MFQCQLEGIKSEVFGLNSPIITNADSDFHNEIIGAMVSIKELKLTGLQVPVRKKKSIGA